MSAATWSGVVGVLGLLATLGSTVQLGTRKSDRGPHLYWFLGLAALLPAWLIAFTGLLGPSMGERPEPWLSVSFIASSAAGLLGVILADGAVRRLHESGRGHPPVTYWLLGVTALFPAWCIALLGLLWPYSAAAPDPNGPNA